LGLLVGAAASACGGAAHRGSEAPRRIAGAPRAAPRFRVSAPLGASVVEIVDGVAQWDPERNEIAYRREWEHRFGVSPSHARALAAWGEVRRRLAPAEPDVDAPLLGRDKPVDRVAAAFRGADDVHRALERAREVAGESDVATLREALDGLSAELDALLAEARSLEPMVGELEARLGESDVARFVDDLGRFYGVSDLPIMSVRLAWWPPSDETSASLTGDDLILRRRPGTSAAPDVDVVVHEAVHMTSRRLPPARKESLSRAFRSKCASPPARVPPSHLLEEPLAVAQQKMFLARTAPSRFERDASWYGDPWVSALAKLVYDEIVDAYARGATLDEALLTKIGRSGRELTALVRALDPPSP
jgi:hypothetical protein